MAERVHVVAGLIAEGVPNKRYDPESATVPTKYLRLPLVVHFDESDRAVPAAPADLRVGMVPDVVYPGGVAEWRDQPPVAAVAEEGHRRRPDLTGTSTAAPQQYQRSHRHAPGEQPVRHTAHALQPRRQVDRTHVAGWATAQGP